MIEFAFGRDRATISGSTDARRVLAVALIAIAGPRARRPQTDGPPAMAFDLPKEKFE
jgi:hypothetical protein